MGLNGSDVAKGAADIVLADDNFSTIVRAIRKGRSVFQNLGKFLVYLLSGNVAEVFVIILGLAFRREGVAIYPIGPVAALWINTLAAGPPALALGVEPTAKDAMDIGPDHFQAIFTPSWYMDTIGYGLVIGAQSLANFVIVQYGVNDGANDIDVRCNDALVGMLPGCQVVYQARGTAFATLQLILMVHAITVSVTLFLGLVQTYSSDELVPHAVQESHAQHLQNELDGEYHVALGSWVSGSFRVPVSSCYVYMTSCLTLTDEPCKESSMSPN